MNDRGNCPNDCCLLSIEYKRSRFQGENEVVNRTRLILLSSTSFQIYVSNWHLKSAPPFEERISLTEDQAFVKSKTCVWLAMCLRRHLDTTRAKAILEVIKYSFCGTKQSILVCTSPNPFLLSALPHFKTKTAMRSVGNLGDNVTYVGEKRQLSINIWKIMLFK